MKVILNISVLLLIASSALILSGCEGENNYNSGYSSYSNSSANEDNTEEEFDPSNYDGSHTVEACNSRTGSCYDLDADIEGGEITQIQFENGGHLDIDGAELSEDFEASGDSYTNTDGYNGDSWDFTCVDCE